MPADISEGAGIIISIFMISDAPNLPFLKLINEMLETFYLHQYVFATAVWHKLSRPKMKSSCFGFYFCNRCSRITNVMKGFLMRNNLSQHHAFKVFDFHKFSPHCDCKKNSNVFPLTWFLFFALLVVLGRTVFDVQTFLGVHGVRCLV